MSTYRVRQVDENGEYVICEHMGSFASEDAANMAVTIMRRLVPGVYEVVQAKRGRVKGKYYPPRKPRVTDEDGPPTVIPSSYAPPSVVDTQGVTVEEDSNELSVDSYRPTTDNELNEAMEAMPSSRAA